MSRLVLCSACLRHVRDDEASCPFCATTREASALAAGPATADAAGSRLGSVSARAAILFFGAVATGACGDGQPGDGSTSNVVMPYGAPPRLPSGSAEPMAVPPYGAAPDPSEKPDPWPAASPSSSPAPSSSGAPATSAPPSQTMSAPVRIVPPYGVPPVPPPPPPPPTPSGKKK